MKLAVIVGTIRQGRLSERLAKWVLNEANQVEGVEATLVDLADYPMPFFEDPVSPRYNPERKLDEATGKWLKSLDEAEAFIFVTPEYNHSIPAVLKNALDYIDFQINRKPSAVVSHGSVGGARATMHLKEILSESKSVPIPLAVAFPGRVSEAIDEQGKLNSEVAEQAHGPLTSLKALIEELKWYSDALTSVRTQK
jgi:NAD(P)H-dependent FMN reductase